MNPLQLLQDDVCASLMANPATNFMPWSVYRTLVIQSAADEADGAWKVRVPDKIGLAGLVLMPSLRVIDPNVPGPQYTLSIVVRVLHDPATNNTGYTCEDMALAAMTWLDGEIFEPTTQLHGEPNGDALAPNYDYPGLLVYDCKLVGNVPQPIARRTPSPVLAEEALTVTLTCADEAAVIYYTTDGTPPLPPANISEQGSFTGKLYQEPFAVPDGTTVRCVAWNPQLMPSTIVHGRITNS